MEVFTVSLFGHRHISNPDKIRRQLTKLVEKLIREKKYVQFLVGHDGQFDEIAGEVISQAIRCSDYHTALLIMVLPYHRNELRNSEYLRQYNQIEICPASSEVHVQDAFLIRNMQMIDRSDMIICCMEHEYGGTFRAVYYAGAKGRNVIQLEK